MPKINTTKISFEGLGSNKVATTKVDPAKAKKPNTGRTHEGPLQAVEHVILLSAGYEDCATRKCKRAAVEGGLCLPCHKRAVAKRNRDATKQSEKQEGRRQSDMDEASLLAFQKRRVQRIKNYAIKGDDDSWALLRDTETIAALALANKLQNIAGANASANRAELLNAFDHKMATKMGLGVE